MIIDLIQALYVTTELKQIMFKVARRGVIHVYMSHILQNKFPFPKVGKRVDYNLLSFGLHSDSPRVSRCAKGFLTAGLCSQTTDKLSVSGS